MSFFLRILSSGLFAVKGKIYIIVFVAIGAYGGYQYFNCYNKIQRYKKEIISLKSNISILKQKDIQNRLNQSLGEKDENTTIPDTIGSHIIKL